MVGRDTQPAAVAVMIGLDPDEKGLGREQVSDIQRARILAAVMEEVAERGAASVTVAHIVGRSGVSRRTYYELFSDREDCFVAAFDEAVERATAIVLPAYKQPGLWRGKVRAGLIALLEFLAYEPCMARLLIVESLGAGPETLKRRRLVLAGIITAVEQGCTEVKHGEVPSPLVAEGIVGGVLSVIHSRLLDGREDSLMELTGPLMSMIALPYVGKVLAHRELTQAVPVFRRSPRAGSTDPLRDVAMRLTYRTVRVLMAVAEHPGSSNREVGHTAGTQDQGQISKLLSRLHRLGLIENSGAGSSKGTPNAWVLTAKGRDIEAAIGHRTEHPAALQGALSRS